MKKTLFVLVVLLSGILAHSQVNFGVRAGANFANYSDSSTSFRSNYYLGAILPIEISEKFTLQPEVNYSKQGAKFNDDNIDVDFVSIGVMAKFLIAEKIALQAGPFIGIKINDNFGEGNSFELELPIDMGISVGADYYVAENFSIEVRVKKGIIEEFYAESSNGYYTENNYTTLVLQSGLTYKFDF